MCSTRDPRGYLYSDIAFHKYVWLLPNRLSLSSKSLIKLSISVCAAIRFLSPSRLSVSLSLVIYCPCARFTFPGHCFSVEHSLAVLRYGRRGKTDDDYRLSDVSTKRHRNCGMPAFSSLFGELSWFLSPEKLFLCSKRTERFWEGARSHHRGSFVALRYFCTLPHGHLGPDGADDGRFGFGSKTFSKVHIKT